MAGEVVFADGSTLAVLISLLNGEVTGFSVYHEPEWPCLSYDDYWNVWSVLPDWKSQDRDRPERWWKLQQFPARVSSKLPLRSTIRTKADVDARVGARQVQGSRGFCAAYDESRDRILVMTRDVSNADR